VESRRNRVFDEAEARMAPVVAERPGVVSRESIARFVPASETAADGRSARDADFGSNPREWIDGAMPYVVHVARRYVRLGVALDDLIAAGNLGLVEAALRFDPARNVRFLTYADWWIRKAILDAIADQSGPVRVPRHRQEQLRALADARKRLRAARGCEPSLEESAREAGLADDTLAALLGALRHTVSLEQPAGPGAERTLQETLAQEPASGPHGILAEREGRGRLRLLVARLDPRARAVVILRFGLDEARPRTLREIAGILSVSRERVRQIEQRALGHLRRVLKGE
jgi:RNA polymerase primary sigma factor